MIREILFRIDTFRRLGWKYTFRTHKQIKNRKNLLRDRKYYGANWFNTRRKKVSQLIRKYGQKCRWCGKQLKRQEITLDHIKPVSEEARNWDLSNLQLLCGPCHIIKNQMKP